MKFSESWLREWVNPTINREALAHQITMAGLEVDEVAPVASDFNGVVIGEVVECAPHPDADKLRVTKVNVGQDELLDIVCGAANCRQGLKVAVATVGATLPGDFKIKKAKLRGQPSHGMLCSFSELGIDIESNGIIELASDAVIGTDIREYLRLDDASIDVDLTANRADCLSIRGLAREVGVLNRDAVTPVLVSPIAPSIDDKVSVVIDASSACPRYVSRIIRNIDVNAKTPLWMQEKLRRSGIRSIDSVVDITNYVMLEQGQPMHAFDLAKIEGGILVRLAKEEEKLTLLDGNEVTLDTNTLVIADEKKPLAIAGIFGGLESGVTKETSDVLLESAFFAPEAIRGRGRSYGLHTDSSHRFERGVDPLLQEAAIERATDLLIRICGGQAGPVEVTEFKAQLPQVKTIQLSRQRLDNLLGHHIASADVEDILVRLGCELSSNTDTWMVTAPSWRFDMAIEEDLIEEVGRIFGYDKIPNQAPVAALVMKNDTQEKHLPLKRVRDLFVARGFYEAITYSFVEPNKQKLIVPDIDALILPNPISQDMSAMRLSLVTGLLNTVAYNQKRQQNRIRLFESGLCFVPDADAENGLRQEMMLAGVITGARNEDHWDIKNASVDFFDLKGDLEAIFELTANANAYSFKSAKHPALHPGQTAAIELNDRIVGYIGALHPELERKFDLNGRTFVFEIEWSAISERVIPEAISISKFPANRRDIAVILDDNLDSDEIVRACLSTDNKLITDAKLFDVYKGKGVDESKKSLAIALTLQSTEKTLEEADISAAVNSVVNILSENFSAILRD
jgi:phenylalanyl-tRNA synthetase beta chain